MSTSLRNMKLGALAIAALSVAACAPSMVRPDGVAAVRAKLNDLQSDSQLATMATLEIQEADRAVRAAEEPRRDDELARHLVVIADRKVDTAWALAKGRLLEDQRKLLTQERDRARLEARTREADMARRNAEMAKSQADLARLDAMSAREQAEAAMIERENAARQADAARSDAEIARSQADAAVMQTTAAQQQAEAARIDQERARAEAEAARNQADAAAMQTTAAQQQAEAARMEQERARAEADAARAEAEAARADAEAARKMAEDLKRQVAELDAKTTERGLVVTLGDVLFETDKAELRGGASANLTKLAKFLNTYPDRTVVIEGHTDSVGSDEYNRGLSQRRADSVRNFLAAQGVDAARMSSSGMGEASPVADNTSTTGRQQNRRVEVIIEND